MPLKVIGRTKIHKRIGKNNQAISSQKIELIAQTNVYILILKIKDLDLMRAEAVKQLLRFVTLPEKWRQIEMKRQDTLSDRLHERGHDIHTAENKKRLTSDLFSHSHRKQQAISVPRKWTRTSEHAATGFRRGNKATCHGTKYTQNDYARAGSKDSIPPAHRRLSGCQRGGGPTSFASSNSAS